MRFATEQPAAEQLQFDTPIINNNIPVFKVLQQVKGAVARGIPPQCWTLGSRQGTLSLIFSIRVGQFPIDLFGFLFLRYFISWLIWVDLSFSLPLCFDLGELLAEYLVLIIYIDNFPYCLFCFLSFCISWVVWNVFSLSLPPWSGWW